MKAPDKIYIAVYPNDNGEGQHLGDWYSEPEYRAEDNLEYIRKDIVDEKIKTAEETIELAEDHAYFAGKEKLREDLLEWLYKQEEYAGPATTIQHIINRVKTL